ncbi:FtsB family cell division protein [Heyndrickxia acidicola]|uniref:Septum formation initiator family protein n=1 Tax=Heyndrickxia acidicola TaxID=209389 RepID=A0ABU6MMT0_9BACI|nr:septum formation initiator family protein [Heyndrickxia acidicola]MED1205999.1 septum formation initiator family protein [Heyndrickxia acidicola]
MSGRPERNIAPLDNAFTKQQQMKDKVTARKRKLLLRRLTLFAIIAGAITYLLVSTLISKNSELAAQKVNKSQLENQVADLKSEKTMLKDQINKLNDNNYIAKLARTEYFLSKKGEIIFNIPQSDKKGSDEDASY